MPDLSNGRDDSLGFRSDRIDFDLDPAEAHVLGAALVIYREALSKARLLGGVAEEAAILMDPIALRVQMRLVDRLYGSGDVPEPDWEFAGDHHVYPKGVAR